MGSELERSERVSVALLGLGTLLLPLQIWPPMPLAGMQLSDAVFAVAFLHFVLIRRVVPSARAAVPVALFAGGAMLSASFGGSAVKLLGHLELAALGWMAASASAPAARLLRLALVLAAGLGAATALVGVVLFYLGVETPLLNHQGVLAGEGYPRGRGTMIRAQMMASVVLVGLVLLWFERELVPQRGLRVALYLLTFAAACFAFSRTTPAALLLLAAAALWRDGAGRWPWTGWAAAAASFVGLLWISIRYQVALDPLAPWSVQVSAPDLGSTSEGVRYVFWRAAVETIGEHPLTGIGPGIPVAAGWTAHNTWLNLWAGLGVLPLAAFAALSALALTTAARAGLAGVAAALVLLLIKSLYTDVEDMRDMWLLLGVALSPLPRLWDLSAARAALPSRR